MKKVIILLVFVTNLAFGKNKIYIQNWLNLNEQQYIENLIACQTTLDDLKWSYHDWPKHNTKSKPLFSQIVNAKKIRESVLENLKMQAVLVDEFGFEITPAMLQRDLDRMANNTRDSKRLKQMFAALNNDARTIAQCISRPYLVQKNFTRLFYNSKSIHENVKSQAQADVNKYITTKNLDQTNAETNTVIYVINNGQLKSSLELATHENTIDLDESDFQQKILELKNQNLQEGDKAFIYREILNQTAESIKVKVFKWPKMKHADWLATQQQRKYLPHSQNSHYALPAITGSEKTFNRNLEDTWDLKWYEPEHRHSHTAVWTGSEMIIWGGGSNTGGRYNPVNDSWLETSTINAPVSRNLHEAVWTGSEMIVWGGGNHNTGGRYDPISDSWTATSVGANVPTGRFNFTAVWTGSEMIIWGGGSNTGGRYNPDTDTWLPTSIDPNTPNSRAEHTAVWTGSEMIIWGGFRNNGGRYNPNTDSWIAIDNTGANVPESRGAHTAVWTGTEMIVWGGQHNGVFNNGGRYNPIDNSWTPLSTDTGVPSARNAHTAVWTGTEMIVWGGRNGGVFLESGARYNPITNTWATTDAGNNSPTNRYLHTAIWSGSEMLVWGGFNSSRVNSGGRYDPAGDSWIEIGNDQNVPSARWLQSTIWTGSEMLVWGGSDDDTNELNNGGRYNPVTDAWLSISEGTNSPLGKRWHSAIWTGTEMIIWGGISNTGFTNTGGRYNPLTDSWITTSLGANVPSARSGHTAIWTGSEMIIWSGDSSETGGKYHPDSDVWEPTSLVDVPIGRFSHSAVWSGSEMIIWGGFNATNLNSGGRYNPVNDTWVPTNINNGGSGDGAPEGRRDHSVVWTGTEMLVWGGRGATSNLNTGGRYSPQNDSWNDMSETDAPSARFWNSTVWTGSEMIVWGGFNNIDTGGRYDPINNTWQSTSMGASLPSPRYRHGAAWTGSEMLIWGGRRGNSNTGPLTNTLGIYYPYNTFVINGNLTGLNGDEVVLQYNGANITLTDNGGFVIDNAVIEGNDYNINVISNPQNPTQVCSVTNGIGTDIMNDVTVDINCIDVSFNVGVTVTGLVTGNSVILENNGGDALVVNTNNSLSNFSQPILEGMNYSITINSQPTSPNQICSIAAGQASGTVNGSDINVPVTCVTESYNLGVTVTGLAAGNSVTLTNNGGDALVVNNNNTLTNFSQPISDGMDYLVSVSNQPTSPNQVCSITSGQETGTVNGTDVSVMATCVTNDYFILVTVSGLTENNSIELSTNGQSLVFNSNTTLSFPDPLTDGTAYMVSITQQPNMPNQSCTVLGGNGADNDGSGEIDGLDVDITVSCNGIPMKVPNTFTIFQLLLLIGLFCFMAYRTKPGN